MRELAAKKGEEALAIVTTPSSCLSSLNWEDNGPLVSKEVMHIELGLVGFSTVNSYSYFERSLEI